MIAYTRYNFRFSTSFPTKIRYKPHFTSHVDFCLGGPVQCQGDGVAALPAARPEDPRGSATRKAGTIHLYDKIFPRILGQ